MAKFLLDTDTCIHILRGRSGVADRLSARRPDEIALSIVTVFELLAGAAKSQQPAREQKKMDLFLQPLSILDWNRPAAETAAQLRFYLEKTGHKIGPYDLLIAAQALASNLILVTGNRNEFNRVPQLQLETWI